MNSTQPQLKMTRPLGDRIEATLATGYVHRLAIAADEADLGRLLGAAFGDGWDVARVRGELTENLEVKATHIVTRDGRIVATASAYRPAWAEEGEGYIHWVAADPAEKGRGLGRYVTGMALRTLADEGCDRASLTTDDDRVPAIVTYLREGFAPAPWHESHAARWETIQKGLR